ncbi:hypothetical protein JCM15457_1779 [Liquorilactobacillus sucicola DSM 21376 = JCM 15457]|uniref:YobI-like P-loop NTPase domain-containing protein n=1 Tax=Liquorilactobacillus sucicola DSM 21376 = JCM 15457 TaxID=1423806 RepID=A0A023CYE9_9LACO|nr:hypothetical protein [Liquorilactobacillus sucicola]KRN07542.1 hypothetical protein FD15_GL000827 [Liquorilactobacillus sucicola DSM 21376 = JCM 15457]GAJ26829.1 hypothetical protein JCM15457_1779 [Liquorilactobacillus sucicola DSM 21376 = JCM 15457]
MDFDKYFKSVNYHSLGPTTITNETEKGKLRPYIKNIEESLKNDTVKNIAVFGKFGAGKSTIINTFLKDHKSDSRIRPLRLSLATFTRNESENPKEDEWIEIERNLVQQILYGPSNKELPDSKYRKIEPIDISNKNKAYCTSLFFALSFLLLIDKWNMLYIIGPYWLNILIRIFLILIMFCSGAYLLYKAFEYIPKFFSSAKIGWGQSELAIMDSKSAFNEYLDEIIYFFTQKKYNLIILEDIDRFNDLSIFEHLRELNQILNNNRTLSNAYNVDESKPAIKFLYAVKEDLFDNIMLAHNDKFKSKSVRGQIDDKSEYDEMPSEQGVAEATTKFFDWTMTILPHVSLTNSADFLMEMFIQPTPDFKNYLRAVSVYFDDVRVLENTINDFKLCLELQDKSDLNPKKMFTILLFKNGFPRQFQKFQRREGGLNKLLRTRDLANNVIQEKRKKLQALKKKKEILEKNSETQVLQMYKALFFDLGADSSYSLSYSDDNKVIEELGKITFAELADLYRYTEISNNEKFTFFWHSPYGNQNEYVEFKHLVMKNDYFDSKIYFENKAIERGYSSIDNKISECQLEINNILGMSIYKIAQKNGVEIRELLVDTLEAQNFLSFGILNGYLNETIDDYLSLFSGQRISIADRQLIRRLRSGELLEFGEHIESVPNFVGDCVPSDFEKSSIALSELIEYVVQRKKTMKDKNPLLNAYNAALKQLTRQSSANFSTHLDELLDRMDIQYVKIFITDLSVILQNDWSKYSGNNINAFAQVLLQDTAVEGIGKCIATLKSLVDYINGNKWPVTWSFVENYRDRADAIFENTNVKLSQLDINIQCDKNLVEYLMENKAVSCSANTITTILESYYPGAANEVSFSLVQQINDPKLSKFIEESFESFLQIELTEMYLQNETQESMAKILTNARLDWEMKENILDEYPSKNLDFSSFTIADTGGEKYYELINLILEKDKFNRTWENLKILLSVKDESFKTTEIDLFLHKTSYLAEFQQNQDGFDEKILIDLVNTHEIEISQDNETVICLANQYLGINQTPKTFNTMLRLNLIKLSMELVNKITNQKEIVLLCLNKLNDNFEEWSEEESALFSKLQVSELFNISTGKYRQFTKLREKVITDLFSNHLEDGTLSDQKKDKLIDVLLSDYNGNVDKILKIYETYDSAEKQIKKLIALCRVKSIKNSDIINFIFNTHDDNIMKLTEEKTGTIRLKNRKSIINLLQEFCERDLVRGMKELRRPKNTISVQKSNQFINLVRN